MTPRPSTTSEDRTPGAARPVVVVGAGPAGVSAAILLAQLGVAVTVLDRWSDVYPQPRAVHLDDEVYAILERLGVASQFADISRPAQGLRLMDRRHRVLAEIDRGGIAPKSGFPRANMFDQPDLERILRQRMHELPLVTFHGNVNVTEVAKLASGDYAVAYEDKETGARQTLSSRYVLGCDGANSLVRRSIGATMEDLHFDQRWLVVDIVTDSDLHQWEGVHQVCDSRRAATYMRIGEDRYRWEFQLLEGENAGDFATLSDVEPLIAPWTSGTDTSTFEVVRAAEYTFRAMIADKWRDDGVFLLGDAAHLTPPFIGQGMGAGMRDAMNLAWKLAGVLGNQLPEEVLDSYEQERKPHARGIIGLAKLTGVLMTSGGRFGDLLRRIITPCILAIPSVRSRVTDSETQPLKDSNWVTPTRHDRLAGRLLPRTTTVPLPNDSVRFLLVTTSPLAVRESAALAIRGCIVVEAPRDSTLGRWLAQAKASAALVRPDGTVLRSGKSERLVVNEATSRLGEISRTAP